MKTFISNVLEFFGFHPLGWRTRNRRDMPILGVVLPPPGFGE